MLSVNTGADRPRREGNHDQGRSPENLLRLRRVPGRAGGGHRRAALRPGRPGHHAHRGGEVRLLPDPGAAAAGDHPGGVAPGVPDAGPGDAAGADGHPGGVSEQLPDLPPVSAGAGPGQGGAVQDHLRGPGAAGDRGVPVLRPGGGHLPGGGGRGPLHLPVGPGLPPLLPEHPRLCGGPAPPAPGGGLHRHRHAGREGGHPPPAGAAGPAGADHRL